MRMKKVYGLSRTHTCPFCTKQALSKSVQGIPVCKDHTQTRMPEVKCACGSWTELREGKWGPYFLCRMCGPLSFAKGLEMFKMMKPGEAIQTNAQPSTPKRSATTRTTLPASATTSTPGTSAPPRPRPARTSEPRHMVVTSDDPRFF
jgi:hypothetical protein